MKPNEIIKRIKNGEPFRIDFEKRQVKLNGSFVLTEFDTPKDTEKELVELFRNYKRSVPSVRADSKYFFAYDETKLSTKELVENESRYIARAKLELFVLGLIVNNAWEFEPKQWYWQSKDEPKLVLFRKWFETKGE